MGIVDWSFCLTFFNDSSILNKLRNLIVGMQAVFCSNSVHILTIELIRNFREVFYRKRGFIKGLRSCISFTKQTNIIFFESLDFSKQAFAFIILKKVSKTCQRIFAKMSLLRACTCIQFKSVPDCVPTSS